MIRSSLWSFLKNIFWSGSNTHVSPTTETVVIQTPTNEATNIEAAYLRASEICQTRQPLNLASAPQLYDDNLLDCCITQWKFGDWQSLIKITKDQLEHHPEREKLAILVAAGHLQVGAIVVGKEFTKTALEWGCSKRLVSQILIAGVHNNLGRAALLAQETDRALGHFKESITVGVPKSEVTLFVQARAAEQIRQTTAQTSGQAADTI
jgi:hypothetical protein